MSSLNPFVEIKGNNFRYITNLPGFIVIALVVLKLLVPPVPPPRLNSVNNTKYWTKVFEGQRFNWLRVMLAIYY